MIHARHARRRAILSVRLQDRLVATDFRERAGPAAEALQSRHGRIELLVLDVRRFAGWGEPGAFAEQIRFLRRHGRAVSRVAVVGNPAWTAAVPAIEALFVEAEVRVLGEKGRGLRQWLRRPAALRARARSG